MKPSDICTSRDEEDGQLCGNGQFHERADNRADSKGVHVLLSLCFRVREKGSYTGWVKTSQVSPLEAQAAELMSNAMGSNQPWASG